jgi:hypothetical protein
LLVLDTFGTVVDWRASVIAERRIRAIGAEIDAMARRRATRLLTEI